jgi:hypothetical protein
MAQSRSAPGSRVHQLLEIYDRAMHQATSLPLIVWVPCRPSQWRLLRPAYRLPRLTLGTRILLIRHIDRSLATLEHRYKAREALGSLSAEQTEDRDMCRKYRESLPLGRFVWTMIAFAVPALVLSSVLDDLAGHLASLPFYGVSLEARGKKIQDIIGALASATASGGNIREVTQVITRGLNMSVADLVVLLVVVFLVGYVLVRPFVPAFRLKRQILNLADQCDHDVRDTASSWHVNKSVGTYQQERKVFAALGYRPPTEHPLDLVVLIFPIICLTVLAATMAAVSIGEAPRNGIVYGLIVALWSLWLTGLGILRGVWLWSTWRGRQDPEQTPPLVGVAGGTGGYVESRPVTEVVAWPSAAALLATLLVGVLLRALPQYPGAIPLAALLYPPLAAIPFYRFALTGDRLHVAAATRNGCPSRRGRPLLAALAFASIIATPIVVLVHLRRLTTLLGVHEPMCRRYRTIAALTSPLLLVLTILVLMNKPLAMAIFGAALIMMLYALFMGAIQRCQNRLVAEGDLATPVRYGLCEASSALDWVPTSSYEDVAR